MNIKGFQQDSINVEDLKISEFCCLLNFLSVELERVRILIDGGRMTSEEIKKEMGIIWVSSVSCAHASKVIEEGD